MSLGSLGTARAHSHPPGLPTGLGARLPLGVVGRVLRCLLQQRHVAEHAGEDEEHGEGVRTPGMKHRCVNAGSRAGREGRSAPEGVRLLYSGDTRQVPTVPFAVGVPGYPATTALFTEQGCKEMSGRAIVQRPHLRGVRG